MISSDSQLPDNNNEDQVTVLITALGNLIENALEALSRESGGEISVSLHYRHGWLHCEVSDDGPVSNLSASRRFLKKASRRKAPNAASV